MSLYTDSIARAKKLAELPPYPSEERAAYIAQLKEDLEQKNVKSVRDLKTYYPTDYTVIDGLDSYQKWWHTEVLPGKNAADKCFDDWQAAFAGGVALKEKVKHVKMDRTVGKPKILFLHGNGGSKMIADMQVGPVASALNADFECPEGPRRLTKADIDGNDGIDGEMREMALAGDIELFAWFEVYTKEEYARRTDTATRARTVTQPRRCMCPRAASLSCSPRVAAGLSLLRVRPCACASLPRSYVDKTWSPMWEGEEPENGVGGVQKQILAKDSASIPASKQVRPPRNLPAISRLRPPSHAFSLPPRRRSRS